MDNKKAEVLAALAVAAQVYDAFVGAVVPGAGEQDLHAAVMQAAGGHNVNFDLLSGPRTAGIEGGATERVLKHGDALLLDLCLQHGDHWCDVCRTYFLGEANPSAKMAYEAVLDCVAFVAGLLKDGVAAKVLYDAAEGFLDARGMAGWMRHHTGHGIGRTPFEAPIEVADSKDVIRAGDVATVEIGVYCGDQYGIRVEDDYWITDNGAENLWKHPKQLADVTLPWHAAE